MNYKIIHDEKELARFIDWLPDLKPNEKYFVSLFARKKYCESIIKSNDKTQLKRFVSTKERIIDKIRQLELPIGHWKIRDMSAPQESLVLYINPNPRCMEKATMNLGMKCMKLITGKAEGYNIHAEALSSIQNSKSYSYVVDFDIDDKDVDMSIIESILPKEAYKILKTRGGYHLLVNPNIAPKSKWYVDIQEAFAVDNSGDQLLPVPGCTQGGFVPIFV